MSALDLAFTNLQNSSTQDTNLQSQYDYLKMAYQSSFPILIKMIKDSFQSTPLVFDNVQPTFAILIKSFVQDLTVYMKTLNRPQYDHQRLMDILTYIQTPIQEKDDTLLVYMKKLYSDFTSHMFKRFKIFDLITYLQNNEELPKMARNHYNDLIEDFYQTLKELMTPDVKAQRIKNIKSLEQTLIKDLVKQILQYDQHFNGTPSKKYYLENIYKSHCKDNKIFIWQRESYIYDALTLEKYKLKCVYGKFTDTIDNLLVRSFNDRSFDVHDYKTNDKVCSFLHLEHDIQALKFLDSQHVVYSDHWGIYVCDIGSNNIQKIFDREREWGVLSGSRIVYRTGRNINIYNAKTGTISEINRKTDTIIVDFVEYGKYLVCVRKTKNIEIWNLETGIKDFDIEHNDYVYSAALVLDNKLALIVKNDESRILKVYNIPNGDMCFEFEGLSRVECVDSTENGKLIITTDQSLYIYE